MATRTTAINARGPVGAGARPLTGETSDLDPLLDLVGGAHVVLIGEASHGTHEFYRLRAALTRSLIEEKGFVAVAVEADWPDAYRVNRYVRGVDDDPDADTALSGFKRFPQWMWRNDVVLDFVRWLRSHNDAIDDPARKAGFYGLDLYSLYTSTQAVVDYLRTVDPEAAQAAVERYSCFDHFDRNASGYAYATGLAGYESCEAEAVEQLRALQRHAADYARRDGRLAEDEYFYAEQNARLVKNAEAYYRSMYRSDVVSWNVRDRHMAEALEALVEHLTRTNGTPTKIVVWAHNSHLGNARATEMSNRGELNLGQLVRDRHQDDARLIGFTTFTGTVTAAHDWGADAEVMDVRPALQGSYERLFHDIDQASFSLMLTDPDVIDALEEPRLERAIGVVYRPETERQSHYFYAQLPQQFDAVIHIDRSTALAPLEREPLWEPREAPETYPFAQ